jgi:hypothetical protein
MITLTVAQLLNAVPVLQELSNQKIKAQAAFRIRKFIQKIEPEFNVANQTRNELFTDENSITEGGVKRLKPEFVEEFISNPFFKEEVKFDIDKLSLKDIEDTSLSPNQIELISVIIREV